jgi:hypothetical protein
MYTNKPFDSNLDDSRMQLAEIISRTTGRSSRSPNHVAVISGWNPRTVTPIQKPCRVLPPLFHPRKKYEIYESKLFRRKTLANENSIHG